MGEELVPTIETGDVLPEDQNQIHNDEDSHDNNSGLPLDGDAGNNNDDNHQDESISNAVENENENVNTEKGEGGEDADENNNNVTMGDLNNGREGEEVRGGGEVAEKEEKVENDRDSTMKQDGGGRENTEGQVGEDDEGDRAGVFHTERPPSAPSTFGEGEDEGEEDEKHESEMEPAGERGEGEGNEEKEEKEEEEEEENEEDEELEPSKAPVSPTETTATTTTLQVKSAVRKHTTTPADDSGLAQPLLPAIPRGQVKVQQIASSISDARKKDVTGQPTIVYPNRGRVPPKLVRLATVTVSPAKSRPAPHGPSLYYEEPKRPQKVITWDQAHNARPPLRIDMEGPGPCSYSPLNKPLNETNAPSFSFGTKCHPEKPAGIGSRTSWAKSWFQSSHPYHQKADYVREGLWPSPTHYPKPNTLGVRTRTMYEAPSYTFGHKGDFSFTKPGAHKEPSPTDYERQTADRQVLKRGPSFSHQFRREGTVLWGCTESNPGPAAYTPITRQKLQKPSYTIQGIRRSKSHILGPYSTI